MEALNEKATKVGFKQGVGADVELHTRVDWLETRLKRTNFAQGIGFRVGDKVLDRRSLRSFSLWLVGVVGTVVTALIALDEAAHFGAGACSLTAQESASIRVAMSARNASCAYNMSLASVLSGA